MRNLHLNKSAKFLADRLVFLEADSHSESAKKTETQPVEPNHLALLASLERAKPGIAGIPIGDSFSFTPNSTAKPAEGHAAAGETHKIPPSPLDKNATKEEKEQYLKRMLDEVGQLRGQAREDKIFQLFCDGKMPDFLKDFKEITVSQRCSDGQIHTAKIRVMPDFLALGTNESFCRMPMTPETAQRLAERFGCILPTKKIVDACMVNGKKVPMADFDAVAERLGISHSSSHLPSGAPNGNMMQSIEFYAKQNELVEEDRRKQEIKLGDLVTGCKKELIITEELLRNPGKLAFYGGISAADGSIIQANKTVDPKTGETRYSRSLAHHPGYCDLSHGFRPVSRTIEVDGKERDIADILRHPVLCQLISDETISDAMAFYKKGKVPAAVAHSVAYRSPVPTSSPFAEPTPSRAPSSTPKASPASNTPPTTPRPATATEAAPAAASLTPAKAQAAARSPAESAPAPQINPFDIRTIGERYVPGTEKGTITSGAIREVATMFNQQPKSTVNLPKEKLTQDFGPKEKFGPPFLIDKDPITGGPITFLGCEIKGLLPGDVGIHAAMLPPLMAAEKAIEKYKLSYKPKDILGVQRRNMSFPDRETGVSKLDPNIPSFHAWGIALDIDHNQNRPKDGRGNIPDEVVRELAMVGLHWGLVGNPGEPPFLGKDPMHTQLRYRPKDPAYLENIQRSSGSAVGMQYYNALKPVFDQMA